MANISAPHPPQGDAGKGPDTDHQRGQDFGQHTDNVAHTQTQAIGPVLNHKSAPSVPSTIPTWYPRPGNTVSTNTFGLPLYMFDENVVEPSPFKVPRLNDDNFGDWSCFMKRFLTMRRLWGIVDGTVPCPSDPLQAGIWWRYAHFVAGIFTNHATHTQLSYITSVKDATPKEISDTWNTIYLDRLRGLYVSLMNKIITTKATKGDRVDRIAASIGRPNEEVGLVNSEAMLNDIQIGIIILNAFKGIRKYELAIYDLEYEGDYSSQRVIQKLRRVEYNTA